MCAAGEAVQIVVGTRDVFLNAIHKGGASITAQLRIFLASDAQPDAAPAEVHDRGDGTYAVDCSLQTSCDFEASTPRSLRTGHREACERLSCTMQAWQSMNACRGLRICIYL
jgi:hypothetical protein